MKTETKDILLRQLFYQTSVDRELELDSVLPDYCPSINRLIRIDATPRVTANNIIGDKIETVGKITFGILYESDFKSKPAYTEFSSDFSYKFDIKSAGTAELFPDSSLKCSYLACKLQSSRKFVVKARIAVSLKVTSLRTVAVTDPAAGGSTAHYMTEECVFQNVNEPIERTCKFNEKITLSDNMPNIADIIFANAAVTDCKITKHDDGISFKADTHIKCFYECEKSENADGPLYEMAYGNYTVTAELDEQSLSDSTLLATSAYCDSVEATTETDAYGENRIISIQYTVKIKVDSAEDITETLANDMFFESYDCQTVYDNIDYDRRLAPVQKTFSLEKVFESEIGIFNKIIDSSVVFSVLECTQTPAGIELKGNAEISVLGQTDGGIDSVDFSANFTEVFKFDSDAENQYYIAYVYPSELITTLTAANSVAVHISAVADITTFSRHTKSFSVASELTEQSKDKSHNTLIICYPTSNDSLWSIAKNYHVSPDKLKSNNPSAFDKSDNVSVGTKVIVVS